MGAFGPSNRVEWGEGGGEGGGATSTWSRGTDAEAGAMLEGVVEKEEGRGTGGLKFEVRLVRCKGGRGDGVEGRGDWRVNGGI
jgi:hypothetical protein